jgi:hypothetical protein
LADGCYSVDFYGRSTNHDPNEHILASFPKGSCGIDLIDTVAKVVLPPGRNSVETGLSGDSRVSDKVNKRMGDSEYAAIFTGGGGKVGKHQRYEGATIWFMNSLWLYMLQKSTGACPEKPFPSQSRWKAERDDTGRVTHYTDNDGPGYDEWWSWITCMNTYAASTYQANLDSYLQCDNFKHNPTGEADKRDIGFGGVDWGSEPLESKRSCADGQIFLTKDSCTLMKKSEARSCETVTFDYELDTPISLVFDDSYDLDSNVSIVAFPLNPQSTKRFWTWKGSAKSPLLVHDPEHKGIITRAEQLFGPWTFGGKRSNDGGQPTPWTHGFEALQLLDSNRDNKLSGDELSELGLWFDNDQDAQSQPGEVRSLQQVGITHLFLSDVITNTGNRSFEIKKGFTAHTDGKDVTGRAIDWFGEGSDSQHELLAKHVLFSPGKGSGSSEPLRDSEKAPVVGDIWSEGVWAWTLRESEDSLNRSGFFALSIKNGIISGSTISETGLAISSGGIPGGLSSIHFSALHGTAQSISKDGAIRLSFSTTTRSGIIESHASLSHDGTTLYGTSTARMEGDASNKNITYGWTAKRVW